MNKIEKTPPGAEAPEKALKNYLSVLVRNAKDESWTSQPTSMHSIRDGLS